MEKVTFRQVLQFRQAGNAFISGNPNNFRTKLGYAVKKMLDKVPKLVQPINDLDIERNENISEQNIEFAATDDKGIILYDTVKGQNGQDERHYRYTKENLKGVEKVRSKIIKEYASKIEAKLDEEIEIEPYFATEVMPGLSDIDMSIFKGIVIDPYFEYPTTLADNDADAVKTPGLAKV